jgi:hypothetical protein
MCILTHGGGDLGWERLRRGSGGRDQRCQARGWGEREGCEVGGEREVWWSVETEWIA